MGSPSRRPPHQRPDSPLRQERSIRRRAIHPAAGRGRSCRVGRLDRRRDDNALAEAFNSLFKAELVRNKGPWAGIDDLEIATAVYLDWFNHRRLHGEIGTIPPTESETNHYSQNPTRSVVEASLTSLH